MIIMPQSKSPTMRDANAYRVDFWRQVTVLKDCASGWVQIRQ